MEIHPLIWLAVVFGVAPCIPGLLVMALIRHRFPERLRVLRALTSILTVQVVSSVVAILILHRGDTDTSDDYTGLFISFGSFVVFGAVYLVFLILFATKKNA